MHSVLQVDAPEIEMTDAVSIVFHESAQRYALDSSPLTMRLPPQLDCWMDDVMEGVEYSPVDTDPLAMCLPPQLDCRMDDNMDVDVKYTTVALAGRSGACLSPGKLLHNPFSPL